MLVWLAVVFAGVLGNGNPEAPEISREILSTVQTIAPLEEITLPEATMVALARHTAASKQLVAKLGVDGIIVGELVGKKRSLTLRLAVYSATGVRRSFTELPLRGRALGADQILVISENLAEEIRLLAPADVPKPARKVVPVVEASSAPMQPLGDDEEDPLAKKQARAATKTVAAAEPASMDDEAAGPAVTAAAPQRRTWRVLRVAGGMGIVARKFTPADTTVRQYSAAPVASIGLAGQLRPLRRVAVDGLWDRSLVMHSPLNMMSVGTTISRWEVAANVLATTGRVVVAARGGVGRRWFVMDTDNATRSPDRDYLYAIVGATVSAALARPVALTINTAFQPVIAGDGGWALGAGATFDITVHGPVHARIGGDVQRFTSAGATDLFPSAMASVAAVY
ncbi:MAG: hypothetical protein H0T46_12655 [Deltaproteobacteria bacterium]|nr:hypothetical protein [Deltaproteobacteria bacterium]